MKPWGGGPLAAWAWHLMGSAPHPPPAPSDDTGWLPPWEPRASAHVSTGLSELWAGWGPWGSDCTTNFPGSMAAASTHGEQVPFPTPG